MIHLEETRRRAVALVSVDNNRLEYLYSFIDKYKYNKSQFTEQTLKAALDELIYILEDFHSKNHGLYNSMLAMTEEQRNLMVKLENVRLDMERYKTHYETILNKTRDRKLSWRERIFGKIKRGRFGV